MKKAAKQVFCIIHINGNNNDKLLHTAIYGIKNQRSSSFLFPEQSNHTKPNPETRLYKSLRANK